MGIFCEINLFKPSDEAFQPGQVVSGLIRYAIDEPMEVDRITTSLKGTGYVDITTKRDNKEKSTNYSSREVYVDIDNVIQDVKSEVQVGSYEVKFVFILPHNIPSTLNIVKYYGSDTARCEIKYYIRIKFERPGCFTFNKHFRKEITIISGGTPRLLREPVIYGELKKLTKLFSTKDHTVQIKAKILDSVIPFGGKIQVQFEVKNNSNVLVKSVKTKLIETYKFKATGYEFANEEAVPLTDTKTMSISCGDTLNMPVEIDVPSYIHSLENSSIVSRNYFVRITAKLPMPHRNAVLNIPVQIGATDSHALIQMEFEGIDENILYNDPPPSYWEAMGETQKENEMED